MRASSLRWLLAGLAALVPAWGADQANWAARSVSEYISLPDITYFTAGDVTLKLDVYRRRGTTGPQPALIYIHGGGWVGGSKGGAVNLLLPWFEMGFTIVNVEYRLARAAPAPAAVADCLCALRWVATRAQNYGIDTSRLVISGESAGGHLALTTSMIPETAALDKQCPGVPLPKIAAVVNFYGITDVADLLEGPNQKGYAVSWIGNGIANGEDRQDLAKRVSPLTYVRPGLPPILSIQGDADPTVPYSHSVRLQEALEKADVPHQLVTIAGGKHGMFTGDEYVRIYDEIRTFLTKYNLLPK
jgi:acetyl esterase/lipase